MAISDDKFELISTADELFSNALKGVDEQLAKEIIKIYAKFVVGGELVLDAEQLAQIDQAIITAISKTSYGVALDKYLPTFEAIEDMNKLLHKEVNNININKVINENSKIANQREVITSQLRGTPTTQIKIVTDGVTRTVPIRNASLDELVNPIAEVIRRDVITGISFESATDAMLDAITRNQLGLEQWAGQISRDALSQADGITQNEVRKEFDLKVLNYIGTVKDTTRPFCFHVLRDLPDKISEEELEKALNEYIPNGVPSKSTTGNTPTGKREEKGSGMIPGTAVDNFTIYRGGYRCRHEAVWSKK